MSNQPQLPKPDYTNPKTIELLKRLNSLKSNMQAQFEQVAHAKGMSLEQYLAYFSNPQHFTPQQWQTAQMLRQELSRTFKIDTTDPKKKRKSDAEVAQDDKNRKAKLLGARKRWLPMR